jgi:hypothetical protein
VANLGEADPGEADPGEANLGEADPGEADPGEADLGEADPGEADPGEADPGEADLRAARFRAQRLDGVGPGGDVVGLVRHLLAVQAQDPAAFPLALRARMPGLSVRDLEQARADRLVVRCWGPRGTLHLIAAEDLGWLYPLVKPSPAGSVRRLRQLTGSDIDAEAGASAAAAALAGQGPLTKAQLGSRLASAGLRAEGQAIVHLAFLAACMGLVVLGPEQAGKPTYVHTADWLGAPLPTKLAPAHPAGPVPAAPPGRSAGLTVPADPAYPAAPAHPAGSAGLAAPAGPAAATGREAAVRTLVARYQAAHAPCTPADLAAWSGLPYTEITRAWSAPSQPPFSIATATPLPVRLLPAFDEYLLGWRSRDHAVREEYRRLVHPGGGIIRATVLVDGLAAGTWQARRSVRHIDITVYPFQPLRETVISGIAAEAADIGTFLGLDARLGVAQ